MRLFIILIILFTTINSYADINVSGGIKYTTLTSTTIEQPTEPANPTTNMLWRNTETNVVKVYNGSEWKVKITDAGVIAIIKSIKTEYAQITDSHAKEAMRLMFKLLLKLYGEELP